MKTGTITSKEELTLKIKKSSKIATVLARITGIVGIVGIVLAMVIIGIMLVDYTAFTTFFPDNMAFDVVGEYVIQSAGDYIAAFTDSLVEFLIYTACAFLAAGIFKRISEDGMPFKTENTKSLKVIGILIIASSFIPTFLASIAGYASGAYTGENLTVMVRVNLDAAMIGAQGYYEFLDGASADEALNAYPS